MLFRTSRREAKMVAHLYRELEDLSRRKRARIQLADNRSRPEDEGDPGVGLGHRQLLKELVWGRAEARKG